MKKLYLFTFMCLLAVTASLRAQSTAQPKFIPRIDPPIPVIVFDSDSLRVSRIDGMLNGENGFSLRFENKTDRTIMFSAMLYDKNNTLHSAAVAMELAPRAVSGYTNLTEGMFGFFVKTSEVDPVSMSLKIGTCIRFVAPAAEEETPPPPVQVVPDKNVNNKGGQHE